MSDSSQPEIEALKAALLDFMSQAAEGQRDIRQLILQLGSSVDAIGSSFADVAQNAKALRSEMTDLRVQLMARIDRLQTRMDGVRDDITTNMGASDAGRRAHDNTRDDVRGLQDSFSMLWRRIRTLEDELRELKDDQSPV